MFCIREWLTDYNLISDRKVWQGDGCLIVQGMGKVIL
jgi:hypothetical protein